MSYISVVTNVSKVTLTQHIILTSTITYLYIIKISIPCFEHYNLYFDMNKASMYMIPILK